MSSNFGKRGEVPRSGGAGAGSTGAASDALKSYICGIARHKAIDRYRKLTARPATIPISDVHDGGAALGETLSEPDVAEMFARGHDEAVIAKAVDGLPPADGKVLRFTRAGRGVEKTAARSLQ
ncbi:MAG: hypothetical protein LBG82_01540 [Clostridiales Family XIII bacterium]|nr:hypothetical protein [Clostridiales Family XIII bacterium]